MLSFLKAAPRGMLISAVIAFIFLNGLGVWQLYRLQWKEGLIADLARTENMPAVPIGELLSPNSSLEFGKGASNCLSRPMARKACVATERKTRDWRSVTLAPCTIDPGHVINMHSEMDGEPGYRVLTICPLSGGQTLLIDLGFSADRQSLVGPVTIDPVGRLRPADKISAFTPVNTPAAGEWYSRSTPEIAALWHTPLRRDYFLVLDVAASRLSLAGLRQGPVTAPLPNRHFEYALTWFSLAWIMVGMFIAFVRQKQAATRND